MPVPFAFLFAQEPRVVQYWVLGQEGGVDVHEPAQVPLPSLAHRPVGQAVAVCAGHVPLLQWEAGVCCPDAQLSF